MVLNGWWINDWQRGEHQYNIIYVYTYKYTHVMVNTDSSTLSHCNPQSQGKW